MSKLNTGRSHVAQVAHMRNSAGSMRHKCAGRGGARNNMREFLDLSDELDLMDEFQNSDEGDLFSNDCDD